MESVGLMTVKERRKKKESVVLLFFVWFITY